MCCSSAAEIATKISFSEKNGGPLPKIEACNSLQPSQEIRYIIVLLYIQSFNQSLKEYQDGSISAVVLQLSRLL